VLVEAGAVLAAVNAETIAVAVAERDRTVLSLVIGCARVAAQTRMHPTRYAL
jgi:hypothetical protein